MKLIHPIFQDSPSNNAKLWRYLSITKLISLLESNRLHFTRVDQYNDHFEGVWPKKDLEYWNNLQGFNVPSQTESLKRTKIASSCWIGSKYESAAMWRLYAPGEEGIAITTTYGKLQTELTDAYTENYLDILSVSKVKYIDHVNDGLISRLKPNENLPNTLWPFMLKNMSYKHEKEVRALLVANLQDNKAIIPKHGIDISINTNRLIDKIIINPLCEDWLSESITGLLKKYDIGHKIQMSSLSKKNFYMEVLEEVA